MKVSWNSLQVKIPTLFILAFLLVLAAIFGVFSTLGKNLLEKQAYKEVVLSGENIVSELGNRTAVAESLATALANLGEKLPRDDELNRKLVEHVMNYEGTEAFIAGGGLWPAPYRYDPAIERRSFFWGRDSQGVLRYFDDYNDPAGPGYHNEEWYVPAKHLREGELFWSESYVDPYSYQPMVTVTVPMFRDDGFYGVSTVDLKLEGLRAFLEEVSRSYGGYAFAVDRNGKLLAFPDEAVSKIYGTDKHGARTEDYIDVAELAGKQPKFQPLASAVQDTIDNVLASAARMNAFSDELADAIADDSYQIGKSEAQLIAAVLADTHNPDKQLTGKVHELFLDEDMLLGEPAFAAVFEMPRTYWKIVTVMPYSKAIEASNVIYNNLVSWIVVVMLVSLALMLFLVRRTLVRPISDMSQQLKLLTESDDSANTQLKVADRGELGNLAFWFNQRSHKLFEVQQELREAREELEHRVVQRTEELREEIEKRKASQIAREERVARVERQHAAVVKLSLHQALYEGNISKSARIIDETAATVIGVDRASILLINEEYTSLDAVDLFERKTGVHSSNMQLRIQDHPSYFKTMEHDRSIAVSDMLDDERTRELRAYGEANGVTALLNGPIRIGGRLRGVVCFEHQGGRRVWHDDEIRFCGEIADQFVQVLANAERIRSEERIRYLAFYDPLTELANRRLLQEAIQHDLDVARRHGLYGSLIYLDLDNFKTLNDSLGHHVGDELLVQLSKRLLTTLRKEDTASRLGGDEFVVLISGEYSSRQEAMEQSLNVARKIQTVIGEPYRLHGYEHIISASIGISLYPEHDDSAMDILKQADTAMYRAKEDRSNAIRFYNPEMQAAADNRLTMEKELRTAIAAREFELYYQPQVDCHGVPVAAEALLRWKHPKRGIVSPADFVPVAEETGLILELGAWMLKDACAFSKEFSLGHVAINISPLQFRQPDFVDSVSRTLGTTGADPCRLMIEITEGIVIENIDDTIDKMESLKEMGIRISIDDFGTGYSSLAYLKRLPLDQLKICREFVGDISPDTNNAIIVDTIISMARHLGLDVVAEGVETEEQLGFCNARGCHILQGYYFSPPLPREAFKAYLAQLPH